MSDGGSYNPSNESPRSGSPILIPPVLNERDSSVEEVLPPATQLAEALALASLPNAPISPQSAGRILSQHAHNTHAVQEIARSLQATATRRDTDATRQLADAQRRAGSLQLTLLHKEEELRRLQE
jgi:hypothetical protein